MTISLRWLRKYIDLPDAPAEVASMLTRVGLECEAVIDNRADYRNIVVGLVKQKDRHQKADKLSVCIVDDGSNEFVVVCGAPNVDAGQKVAFARVGAFIKAAGITIEERAIRGVVSHGMICSESELGLSADHSGILVLSDDVQIGQPLLEALGLDDVSFEIGITPNRGDALSHVGVARDLAALLGTTFRIPSVSSDSTIGQSTVAIENFATEDCPRYSGAVIRGVRIEDSPEWLRNALHFAGIRAINNVVDITNYVMLEIGQPMHAFDLTSLEGGKIVIRQAREEERFTTLDEIERVLPERALLICDAIKPVAIAGVMGGVNSGISDRTTDIFLESAFFDPASVRRTAKYLGLSTESSYRFERRTDPERTVWALQRAVDLILEIAGGTYEGLTDVYPETLLTKTISMRPDRVNRVLGVQIPEEKQRAILEALGYRISKMEPTFDCAVPSFATDIEREVDLIEEIARIFGYDNIPTPERTQIHSARRSDAESFITRIRGIALSLGFDEILSPSLISRTHAKAVTKDGLVEVLNPVSKEAPILRPGLLPSLLHAVDHNVRNGTSDLRLFEIGSVFTLVDSPSKDADVFARYREEIHVGFALSGIAQQREWFTAERPFDFFDLKGALESLFRALGLDNEIDFVYDSSGTYGDCSLSISAAGESIGYCMTIPETIASVFELDKPVFLAEMSLSGLERRYAVSPVYKPVSRFPLVLRDLALVVNQSVPAKTLNDAAWESGAKFLDSVRIIDLYAKTELEEKKSITLAFVFKSDEHTLTDLDIQSSMDTILRHYQTVFNASLRT